MTEPIKNNLCSFICRVVISPACLILIIFLSITGCQSDEDREDGGPEPAGNIFQLLQTTPGLDSIARYVQFYPEIVTQINSSGSLTFFAPSNTAFENLLNTEGFPGDIRRINADVIRGVLFYHLILGALKSEDLTPGKIINTLYPGESISINSDGTLRTGSSTNPNIEITQKDIPATNGYIQVVEDVLIPPTLGSALTELTGTVAGTILLYGDFSILANALLKADTVIENGQTPLLNILRDEEVTLLAPPDAVFKSLGLEVGDRPGSQWRLIIQYHMIPGTIVSEELTQRSYTSMEGEDLFNTNGKFINGFSIAVPDASPAANGTMHVLSGLLRPGMINGGDIGQVAAYQGFDSMVVAMQLAGLDVALAAPNGPYTVFTPPNEAFAAFLSSMGVMSLSEIPVSNLLAILSHHVTDGVHYSSDFENDQNLNTLAGIDLTIQIDQEGISVTDGSGTVSRLISVDLTALNGVIHVVDRILLPE
jgi:transforming growth factor-beta-induced protein